MIRILWLLPAVVLLAVSDAAFGSILLEFDALSPGTLADSNGVGTGFTTRLPGSGAAIPANDPNLTLDTLNGVLRIISTRSDFNLTGFGRNLGAMEAPAVFFADAGNGDFIVSAKFLDLHADQLSDQIGVFVGTSVDNVARGGVHESPTPGVYQSFFNWSQNGVDGNPNGGSLVAFNAGDDAIIQLGRIGGAWHFRWQNLDSPGLSGSIENFNIPGLDSQADLYFGVFNHDARNTVSQLATLDFFRVQIGASVPAPPPLLFMMATLLWSVFKRHR
jgi:hypothetical protein